MILGVGAGPWGLPSFQDHGGWFSRFIWRERLPPKYSGWYLRAATVKFHTWLRWNNRNSQRCSIATASRSHNKLFSWVVRFDFSIYTKCQNCLIMDRSQLGHKRDFGLSVKLTCLNSESMAWAKLVVVGYFIVARCCKPRDNLRCEK
jgi:hypothetical protein